jgi:hypothetical protein
VADEVAHSDNAVGAIAMLRSGQLRMAAAGRDQRLVDAVETNSVKFPDLNGGSRGSVPGIL